MNNNQEQSSSRMNIDAEYDQICNTISRVSQHLKENPDTHLGAVQSIGAASSHLGIAAGHIDGVYFAAKEKDREILMLTQHIKQLDDMIVRGNAHNDDLIKRLNTPLSIDEVQGFFRSEKANGLHEAFKAQVIDTLRGLKEVQEQAVNDV